MSERAALLAFKRYAPAPRECGLSDARVVTARYSRIEEANVLAFVRHLRDCELLRARAEAEVDRG